MARYFGTHRKLPATLALFTIAVILGLATIRQVGLFLAYRIQHDFVVFCWNINRENSRPKKIFIFLSCSRIIRWTRLRVARRIFRNEPARSKSFRKPKYFRAGRVRGGVLVSKDGMPKGCVWSAGLDLVWIRRPKRQYGITVFFPLRARECRRKSAQRYRSISPSSRDVSEILK